MSLPKIRKAKSQSFRTRRSPSERKSPSPWNLGIEQKSKRNPVGQRSPGSSIYESKSSSASVQSQKSPLSRQGTVRASHRRKNSMTQCQSLNLSGRRSPGPLLPQDRSPSGRRSPNYLAHDLAKSPMGLQLSDDNKSPTGKRSPIGFSHGILSAMSVTPTEKRSPGSSWDRQKSPTTSIHVQERKSPMGSFNGFYNQHPKSPTTHQLPIPPITISNPSETCGTSLKSACNSGRTSPAKSPRDPWSPKDPEPVVVPEKKEKTSVMREILAFVRKPSKKVSNRTSRFAAAFSRTENDPTPLVRQSTYSSTPTASSRAGRNAVTKQMSYEPKISTKLKNVGSKMSLKLRRNADVKVKDKKSSGEDISDIESSDGGKLDLTYRSLYQCGTSGSAASCDGTFELESVHFEKVGQNHKKHEQQIVEEESPNQDGLNEGASTSRNELEKPRSLYEELKRSIETLFENKEPIYENIEEFKREQSTDNENDDGAIGLVKHTIQCQIQIEPPSRRASFDPPRSPFLENLRSLSDTDHDVPSGESFEVVDTGHNRESSFEDRHSSMDTSFDISRYQSTSYDDQTSSFELIEANLSLSESQTQQATPLQTVKEDNLQASNIDLTKSSIEVLDVESFQKASPAGRKSSLETHFDLSDGYRSETPVKSAFVATGKTGNECFPIGMKATHQASLHHQLGGPSSKQRTKSPLSNQTSSNYSSRDSYDSSSTYEPMPHPHSPQLFDIKNPYSDMSKHHYPMPRKFSHEKTFLCIDKRCASIFEPRPQSPQRTTVASTTNDSRYLNTTDTSSGSEFEAPSPRRALSASPKHTFTFRIVMKKVESSPDDLCPTTDRHPHRQQRDRHRRDSRRRKPRLSDVGGRGKSF